MIEHKLSMNNRVSGTGWLASSHIINVYNPTYVYLVTSLTCQFFKIVHIVEILIRDLTESRYEALPIKPQL